MVQPKNLLKNQGLRFVTSSLEKKELATKAEIEKVSADSAEVQEAELSLKGQGECSEQKNNDKQTSAYAAYDLAASAASHLHSQTKSIHPFKTSKAEANEDLPEGGGGVSDNVDIMTNDMAS